MRHREEATPIKRSIAELWEHLEGSQLGGVHLDEFRSHVMQFCFYSGIRLFLAECDAIGRAHRGEPHVIAAYIERCEQETGAAVAKYRPRVRRGSFRQDEFPAGVERFPVTGGGVPQVGSTPEPEA